MSIPDIENQAGRYQTPRAKVRSIAELGEVAAEAKSRGKRVVQCHGVFDLLHMGHVRHLEVARREGDVLIVTITADKFVNKGPGRPVFTQAVRAEMLASLEYVDYVGVHEAKSANGSLDIIKPDVYVKGSDYKDAAQDVTGNILEEHETVAKYGGKVVFTDEVTFSSSALINRYLGIYEPTLQQFLDSMRTEDKLDDLISSLDTVKDMKVVLVGEAIVDEYQYVEPLGKSAKENMIAAQFREREVFAGGVFAAANHVADFCREVEVITCLGAADSYEDVIRDSLKPNVKLNPIYREDAPTTRKCRFIDTGYSMRKMFEVYFMDDRPTHGAEEDDLHAVIEDKIKDADVVIAADFGHGLITKSTVELLTKKSKFLAVNTQSNSANHGYNLISKYPRADYVCIDGTEAKLAVHDKFADMERIIRDGIPSLIDCGKIVVTHGKQGCYAGDADAGITKVPALTSSIVDTVGAGDAFFAVTAPLVAAKVPMDTIGFIGNAVGAIKVGIVGHRESVEKAPLTKFITALLK